MRKSIKQLSGYDTGLLFMVPRQVIGLCLSTMVMVILDES